MKYYKDSTQHYAHHDAAVADRNEQELRDAIMRQLKLIFVKLITQEKMARKPTFKKRLKYIMKGHLSYFFKSKTKENESFVS
jgi:hypothetical protein